MKSPLLAGFSAEMYQRALVLGLRAGHAMPHRIRATALAFVTALAVAAVWVTSHDVEAGRQPTATRSDESASFDAVPAGSTWREYLAAYWGDKWPALEGTLHKDQLSALDRNSSSITMPSWETVSPLMRNALREDLQQQRSEWSRRFESDDELDLHGNRLNAQNKDLTEHASAAIRSIVDRYSSEIDAKVQQSFDLTAEAEETIWDRHMYRAQPLIDFPDLAAEECRGQLVLMRKWARGGWTVAYTIDSAKWPELNNTLLQLKAVKAERDRAIRDVIAGQR